MLDLESDRTEYSKLKFIHWQKSLDFFLDL